MQYDMLVVGGGLAGAALAWVQAARGVRVLVLERERRFKDRVRGENLLPWGVTEARELGILGPLVASCGHQVDWWSVHRGGKALGRRNLVDTTAHRTGCLDFHHPAMQDLMLGAAEQAGAQVRRGVLVTGIERGRHPVVIAHGPGGMERLETGHVVIASGRHTGLRAVAGFAMHREPERLRITGALVDGMNVPEDSVHVLQDPARPGCSVLVFPLGRGRFRVYLVHTRELGGDGLVPGPEQGRRMRMDAWGLRAACMAAGMRAAWLDGSEVVGPIATFEGAGSWVEHPHHDRVTLIGDAAATTDPSWGCGLALALRDVRVLCERLQEDDWERAAHGYAEAHDVYHGALHRIQSWLTELFYAVGPKAEARRAHALALQGEDEARRLDLVGLGPEAPSDEAARRRFFGEDRLPSLHAGRLPPVLTRLG